MFLDYDNGAVTVSDVFGSSLPFHLLTAYSDTIPLP